MSDVEENAKTQRKSVFTVTVEDCGSSLILSKADGHSFVNAVGSAIAALIAELRDYCESPHYSRLSLDEKFTAEELLFFLDSDEDTPVRERYRQHRKEVGA